MSQGQSVTPSPPAAIPINWAHIISVCVTVIGMLASQWLHSGGQIQPAPSPPSPPVPDPPISIVSIVDVKGNAVADSIDAGKLFIVTGPDKSELTAVVPPGSDVDIFEVAPNKINAVLRSGTIQIVVTGVGKPSIVNVKCGHGSQPPPDDKTKPGPDPVVTQNVSVSIVTNLKSRTAQERMVLYDDAGWDKLRDAGTSVILYSSNDTSYPATIAKNALSAANVSGTGVVITNTQTGAVLYSGPLIDANDIASRVQQLKGGK